MGGDCYGIVIDHFGLIYLFPPTNFASKDTVSGACKKVILVGIWEKDFSSME